MFQRCAYIFIFALVHLCSWGSLLAQDVSELGGDLTVSDRPARIAVTLPAPNISSDELFDFHLQGFVEFNTIFAKDSEGQQILGPNFNHRSCNSCHINDGRGAIKFAESPGSPMLVKVSLRGLNADGSPRDVPGVGEQLQDHTIGKKTNNFDIKLNWIEEPGRYPDGQSYSLRRPEVTFEIPGRNSRKIVHSLRMTPQTIGMGLLEAVPDSVIESLADPDDLDADGISGKVNRVWDRRKGDYSIGRFGFRASHPSIEQQSGAAFFNDMGMTSELFTESSQPQEVSDLAMEQVVFYLRAAGIPAARNQDDPRIIKGKELFQQIGCDDCHKMTLTTETSSVAETSNQVFHPFTDLLLHDMGPGLADERPEFSATGREWRTTPLWGIGLTAELSNAVVGHLHDGRARTIEEAILWHAGEAKRSRNKFKQLRKGERKKLLRFLKSL